MTEHLTLLVQDCGIECTRAYRLPDDFEFRDNEDNLMFSAAEHEQVCFRIERGPNRAVAVPIPKTVVEQVELREIFEAMAPGVEALFIKMGLEDESAE